MSSPVWVTCGVKRPYYEFQRSRHAVATATPLLTCMVYDSGLTLTTTSAAMPYRCKMYGRFAQAFQILYGCKGHGSSLRLPRTTQRMYASGSRSNDTHQLGPLPRPACGNTETGWYSHSYHKSLQAMIDTSIGARGLTSPHRLCFHSACATPA